MTKRTTLVNFVLDETGSMYPNTAATISAFNEYIQTLSDGRTGPMKLFLTQFNSSKLEVTRENVPVQSVPEMTEEDYRPAANTPLYDAIARSIRVVEGRAARYKNKPLILTTIMTDGEENDSRTWTREKIFDLIKEKEAEGWDFSYLGVGTQAWVAARSVGIPRGSTTTFVPDAAGTQIAVGAAAGATLSYSKSGGATGGSVFDGAQTAQEYLDQQEENSEKEGGDN